MMHKVFTLEQFVETECYLYIIVKNFTVKKRFVRTTVATLHNPNSKNKKGDITAAITLGIGPHSSFVLFYLSIFLFCLA